MDQPLARTNQDSSHDASNRMVGLLSRPFGIGWLDKNKVDFSKSHLNLVSKGCIVKMPPIIYAWLLNYLLNKLINLMNSLRITLCFSEKHRETLRILIYRSYA